MAGIAASVLLESVTQLLEHQSSLIYGAENEIRQLKEDIELLKDFFLAVEIKKPKEERPLREMERQTMEVIYEVEDTLDACLSQAAAANNKNFLSRHLVRKNIGLPKVVKSLRQRVVKPILDRVKDYGSNKHMTHDAPSTSVEEQPSTIGITNHAIRRDNVVGLEIEEHTIIGYLGEEKDSLDVISIVGMGGLGKTTLARKIYENEQIMFDFPVRIWINVSQEFNKRDVLLNILIKFTRGDTLSLSEEELTNTVRACLEREKFLLVFDDVCSLGDWKYIQYILPKSNPMGKVLITSRDNMVGRYANPYREPHKMRFLNIEESWKLLQLVVFGMLGDCPSELEGIGQHIAIKCGGLPIQIVAVGGILVDLLMSSLPLRTPKREWQEVSDNVDLFLRDVKSISGALELTYSRLPDRLRVCFLYMGVFPEDYEIQAWTLTRLWIAEGFIQPTYGRTLEESATQYLDDLISRNLVMADKINTTGEIKKCRVHDMIRTFCRDKAQEQNLFQVIKWSREGILEPGGSEIRNSRRLSVHSNVNTLLSQVPKSPRVRSFLCFSEPPTNMDPHHISTIPDTFDLLKVLESKSIKFHQMPRRITRLLHLRYITLSVDDLKILPETLSELWNLQTLVVDTKLRVITMKANIWMLIRLRHLKTNAAIVLGSERDGAAGESLQTLSRLSPQSCTAELCKRACNLKTLGIQGKLATLFENSSLENLGRLEKLKLVNEAAHESPLRALPQHNFFPPSLMRLTLSNTFLPWKHMSTLGNMSNLEVIKLKDNAFTGIYWSVADDCFANLEVLLISNADLIQWEAPTSSFPKLKCLVLMKCENLNEIPRGLAGTLHKLDISHVRKSAVDSASGIAKEKATSGVPFKLSIGPLSS